MPIWGSETGDVDPAMVGVLAAGAGMMPPAIPIATYRVQLTADFDFDAAAAIVPYLKALGITHLYASPFMKARKGSTHGYDIVDHTRINPELGGDAGFERLSSALKQHDLGLILDFVPNHVGVHFADNPWWLDVLEWGPASPHAVVVRYRLGDPAVPRPRRRLAADHRLVLWRGAGKRRDRSCATMPSEGSFSAWYFEHRLPIAPERYSEILRSVVKEAGAENSAAGKRILDLASRYKGLRHPNRKEAPAFKAELKSIAGGAEIIARGLDAYRAGPDRPAQIAGAASSAGTPALQARPLAACLQRHQLSALFRHQYAGRIAGRGCRHVRAPSIGWSKN